MKKINLGKTVSAAVLMSGMFVAANVLAASPQGDDGPGYGMMGGCGQGAGMGPGMMGGSGMGPGMMGGRGFGRDLNLSPEQRSKLNKIQDELRHKHWELMGKIQDEQSLMREQFDADPRDDAALGKSYRQVSELQRQMFESTLAARRQIDAVLTKEQREKLKHGS